MEKLSLAFLGVLIVLLFTHIIRIEAFGDGTTKQPGKVTYKYIFDPLTLDSDVYDGSGSYLGSGKYNNIINKKVTDSSGSDVRTIGSYINLSISDLLALIGRTSSEEKQEKQKHMEKGKNDYDYPMYNAVQQQQQNHLNSMYYGGLMTTPHVSNYIPAGQVIGQPINMGTPASHADAQGQAFMKYQYGINPADYIRKDSIPCYACTLPA